MDSDQTRRFVGSDLGPDCLQKLSADDTSRQSVLKCGIKKNTQKTVINTSFTSLKVLQYVISISKNANSI